MGSLTTPGLPLGGRVVASDKNKVPSNRSIEGLQKIKLKSNNSSLNISCLNEASMTSEKYNKKNLNCPICNLKAHFILIPVLMRVWRLCYGCGKSELLNY